MPQLFEPGLPPVKALVIQGPDRFGLTDVSSPSPAPNEVVVDVLASGVCGTDLEILHGDMIYFTSRAAHYPVVPGHEWTGRVSALGSNVSHFKLGDHVVGEVSIGCCA